MTTHVMKSELPNKIHTQSNISPFSGSSPAAAYVKKISEAPFPRARMVTAVRGYDSLNLSVMTSKAGERY